MTKPTGSSPGRQLGVPNVEHDLDKYYLICLSCTLDDCVRVEGEYSIFKGTDEKCPITIIKRK